MGPMLFSQAASTGLTEAEWLYLCEMCNGHMFCGEFDSLCTELTIPIEEDLAGVMGDPLREKWGVDAHALLAKLRSFTTLQIAAVINAIEEWWGRCVSEEQLQKYLTPERHALEQEFRQPEGNGDKSPVE